MLRVGTVVLNVSDTRRAAEFWAKALGYAVRGGAVDDDESAVLVATEGQGLAVTLDEDDRMHLDLHVDSEEDLQTELERLVDAMHPVGDGKAHDFGRPVGHGCGAHARCRGRRPPRPRPGASIRPRQSALRPGGRGCLLAVAC